MSRRWEDAGLSESSLAFVRAQGFAKMTPVQAVAIPQFLKHKDLCVEACTGSGKTLSFLLPVVEMLLRQKIEAYPKPLAHVVALVLAPTRELAEQIYAVLQEVLGYVPDGTISLRGLLFIGGRPVSADRATLEAHADTQT